MTERSIVFSAPMILAILGGAKSQTRRLVKPKRACPYAPGDALWTKEAWRMPVGYDALTGAEALGYDVPPIQYEADGHRTGEWASSGVARRAAQAGRYRHARWM